MLISFGGDELQITFKGGFISHERNHIGRWIWDQALSVNEM